MMLLSLLTILFVGLKLTGYIDWSWWLVVAPTLFHVTFVLVMIALAAFVGLKNYEP
jgi:hypothetical protein